MHEECLGRVDSSRREERVVKSSGLEESREDRLSRSHEECATRSIGRVYHSRREECAGDIDIDVGHSCREECTVDVCYECSDNMDSDGFCVSEDNVNDDVNNW